MVSSAEGDLLLNLDGVSYIDYCMGWGALILGHAPQAVNQAIVRQLAAGSLFGFCSEGEGLLAQKLLQALPYAEKVRFLLSGTEATMTAIRLARGVTGRSKIVRFAGHYHGHSDATLAHSGSRGIPEGVASDLIILPWNDFGALSALFDSERRSQEIAALIMEPIAANMGVIPPVQGFLAALREASYRAGALLIFDEVVTGFRVGFSGAQGLYQVEPDLTCLAKILGGGLPMAALAGKAKFLDQLAPLGPIYHAGTFAGHPLAMQAGLATLTLLQEAGFYERLQEKTDRLVIPIQEALQRRGIPATLQRSGSMFTIFFGLSAVQNGVDMAALNEKRFGQFFRFLWNHGILIPPSSKEAWFVSSAHTDEHLDRTRDLVLEFLATSP